MAVTMGTVVTGALNNGSLTTTVSFTSNGGPITVRVGWWTSALNTVKYGGVDLTAVAQSGAGSGGDRAEIWRLAGSSVAGTANMVLTFANTQTAGTVIIANDAGVNTTTPTGTPKTAVSTGNVATTGSQAIAGAATGDLTIMVVANGNGAAIAPTMTGAGSTTEEFDGASNGEGTEAAKGTNVVTAVSASWTGNTSWALAAVTLKVAGAATKARPVFHRPLRIWNRVVR